MQAPCTFLDTSDSQQPMIVDKKFLVIQGKLIPYVKIFYVLLSKSHYSLLRFSYTSWTPFSPMSIARLVLLPSVAHPGQSSSVLAGSLHVWVGVGQAMRPLFGLCISLIVFLNHNLLYVLLLYYFFTIYNYYYIWSDNVGRD